jgi:hypothetical protein
LPGTGAAAAHDLGEPRWRLELVRCHGGGRPGAWTVAWRAAARRLEAGGGGEAAADAAAGGAAASARAVFRGR